jgi:hypothetical protein
MQKCEQTFHTARLGHTATAPYPARSCMTPPCSTTHWHRTSAFRGAGCAMKHRAIVSQVCGIAGGRPKAAMAGGKPKAAMARHATTSSHELYLQTLQEARSPLAQRPQSAPRQARPDSRLAGRPQSALSEPMQAITERLREAQALALQRKQTAPLIPPAERLKEEVTPHPLP